MAIAQAELAIKYFTVGPIQNGIGVGRGIHSLLSEVRWLNSFH
jgi:hypothetical protein